MAAGAKPVCLHSPLQKQMLSQLCHGVLVICLWVLLQPPDYLTEAELIGLMEKHGIGTDASISTHINNICERNYVQVGECTECVPIKSDQFFCCREVTREITFACAFWLCSAATGLCCISLVSCFAALASHGHETGYFASLFVLCV